MYYLSTKSYDIRNGLQPIGNPNKYSRLNHQLIIGNIHPVGKCYIVDCEFNQWVFDRFQDKNEGVETPFHIKFISIKFNY